MSEPEPQTHATDDTTDRDDQTTRTYTPEIRSSGTGTAVTPPTAGSAPSPPGDSTDSRDGTTTAAVDPEDAVFTAHDLSVRYGEVTALRPTSLAIPERGVTAVVGPSGCGKSTFLRCFNRMNDLVEDAHVEGELRFRGKNVYDDDVDPVALRRRVGMVFQTPNPFPKSVYDNVAYGLRIQGETDRLDERVEDALRRAALWDEVKDDLDKSGLDLSGGQQQRLCIARTIATDPEVILMDEPASALDPVATAKIEELIADLADEYTVLVVTHNMQQAARISDRTAVFLTGGELAAFDDTETIFEDPPDERVASYVAGEFG